MPSSALSRLSSATSKTSSRSSNRRFLAAVPLLTLLFVLLHTRAADSSSTSALAAAGAVYDGNDVCHSSEVIHGRLQAGWWLTELSAKHLSIRPRDSSFSHCTTLADAHFTIRLHFSSGERRLLGAPTQLQGGEYRFELVGPIATLPIPSLDPNLLDSDAEASATAEKASAEVRVEARLDSGYFPKAKEGQPCGVERRECDYEELGKLGVDWSGEEIFGVEGQPLTFLNRFRPLLSSRPAQHSDPPLCSTLSHLPGAWLPRQHTYTYLDASTDAPCRLLDPPPHVNLSSFALNDPFSTHVPPPASAAVAVGSPGQRWIRLLGDSNMRTLLPSFAKTLGATECLSHQGDGEKHPTSLLCWSAPGSQASEDEQVIVSFNWWFGNQGTAEGSTGDHDKLAILLNMSLTEILADIPWDRSGAAGSSWPEAFESFADPPAKVYLSIGSHMPAVTSLGMTHLLTSLEPLLTAPALQDTLVLALVSATDPPRLPKLYRSSKVMRNNLMLEATNTVVEQWAEERGVATLDLFTMSRTAGGEMMKDPVHFWDPMYIVWAQLFYTDYQLAISDSQARAAEAQNEWLPVGGGGGAVLGSEARMVTSVRGSRGAA